MDANDRATKQVLMDEMDARIISPEQRTAKVYEILQKHAPHLKQWDIICFAVNYLGYCASSMLWLEFPAKHLARLVYTAHYLDANTNHESGFGETDGGVAQKIEPSDRKIEPPVSRESARVGGGFNVSGGGFES